MRLKWIVGAMDGQVACLISDGFNRNTTTTATTIIKGITKWKGKKTFNLSPSVRLSVCQSTTTTTVRLLADFHATDPEYQGSEEFSSFDCVRKKAKNYAQKMHKP